MARHRELVGRYIKAAGGFQIGNQRPHFGTVLVIQIKEKAFEIARHLNVHARTDASNDVALAVASTGEETSENIVGIGRNMHARNRKTKLGRDIAGIDIAKIPRRHHEARRPGRGAEGERSVSVIDCLRHDPRPVDRIDCR